MSLTVLNVRRSITLINLSAVIGVAPLAAAQLEITTGVNAEAWRERASHLEKAIADFSAATDLANWATPKTTSDSPRPLYEKLPIAFERREGQGDARVQFIARGAGYGLYFTPEQLVVAWKGPGASKGRGLVRLKLVGANPNPELEGVDPLPGHANYYIGKDRSKWRSHVEQFARVRYHEAYPGVDLVFYGRGRELEYDLVVAPGADPHAVRLAVEGAEQLTVDNEGDAVVQTKAGDLRLRKPVVYQEINGRRQELEGAFVQIENRELGFRVAEYDHAQPLIIDPVVFIAGVGGKRNDSAFGIGIDKAGNSYVTGSTLSTDFPFSDGAGQEASAGGLDVFVTCINRDATAINYSTYLGGSKNDEALAIAANPDGIAFLTGYTASADFPVAGSLGRSYGGGDADAFIAAIDLDGTFLYSTFLGGSGIDQGNGIALGPDGSVYVSGFTNSTNFPLMKPLQPANAGGFDFFVTKLNPTGTSLLYSTYVGGSNYEGPGFGPTGAASGGIAVDSRGNAYIAGPTTSIDFPAVNGFQPTVPAGGTFSSGDAFLAKIRSNGAAPLLYSTYFGGTQSIDYDAAFAVAANDAGLAVITGTTRSETLPMRNPKQATYGGSAGVSAQGDAFFAIFDTTKIGDGSLISSSYLGGNGDDAGYAVTIDPAGNVTVAGVTDSTNFPFSAGPTGGSIFRSLDNGATWQRANNGLVNADSQFSPVAVDKLVVSPSDVTGNTAYIAGRGGIFKTTNFLTTDTAGPTWVEVNTGITDHLVTALAIDPAHPATLFAGTQFGSAFKTVDGGAHWVEMSTGLGFSNASSIQSFVFTPAGPILCSAPGQIGVFKTVDGGAHWTPSNTGLDDTYVYDLIADPADPNHVLYALAGGPASLKPGIYKSTNGGGSWVLANGNLVSSFIKSGNLFPVAMTFAPGSPRMQFLLVNPDFNAELGGLFKSTNNGATYSQLVRFDFDVSSFAVDPTNPNRIFIASQDGVYRSSDGGTHWTEAGLNGDGLTGIAVKAGANAVVASARGGSDGFITDFAPALQATDAPALQATDAAVSAAANSGTPVTRIFAGTGRDEVRARERMTGGGAVFVDSFRSAGTTTSEDFPHVNANVVPPTVPPAEVMDEIKDEPDQDTFVIGEDKSPSASTPKAHLVISKNCTPNPARPGGDIACVIVVQNTGPDTATKVDITDSCDLNDPAKGQKTIDTPPHVDVTPIDIAPKNIRFDLPDLAKGRFVTVKITYKAVAKNFKNIVAASTATLDPGPATDYRKEVKVPVNNNPVPAKIDDVNPDKGKPGAQTTIKGANLNGGGGKKALRSETAAVSTSTVVRFNGVAATIVSISDTEIVVKVPAGATTGPITVTTAAGTATSAQDFVVLPFIQQLLNISTRLKVLTDENVLIGGFIVTGNDDKKVLLRAIGSSLTAEGVQGALGDPVLELHKGRTVVAQNDNWKQTQQAEIEATTIPPKSELESAMVQTLAAHTTGYTAIVSGKGGATGIGLVEAYDLNEATADSQLANISTRGFVDTGENVLIGGVIVGGGSSTSTAKVLVRAIGPSLTGAGVQGALADPVLELHNASGAIVASNDNWKTTQKSEIEATTIPPTNDAESAIVRTLAPGKYTAIVRGVNNTTGVALVEVYALN